MAKRDVECRRFGGSLLYEPEALATGSGQPYRVFTPFWRACLGQPPVRAPLPAPPDMPCVDRSPRSLPLDHWLLPKPDWAAGLRATWTPGEAGARLRLQRFLGGPIEDYDQERDRPDLEATSMLSPHLHHGEISPRQCWHAASMAIESGSATSGAKSFLRELIWREFSYHLLHHFPTLPAQPFRPEFAAFAWRMDPASLERWQEGRTGYPLVDAAMRQLWQTGWMHNRARMVAASFLVKDLLVPWQDGQDWFWDTLVDADLANNEASWQWVAGCGADAAPYFRIFNPVLQSRRFDPQGTYIRRWLPELAKLPTKNLHAPWESSELSLSDAGVRLGTTYPRPMVEHGDARHRALAAYERMRRSAQEVASTTEDSD
jgi:deoxyribodipyrimidine photo-lyase